ncbi:MAG: ferrous iron transport protein A [Comamonadaceae bacterium]|nr:ferrous iron transport protein A [Comamonadaceae bacterium]
MADEDERVTVVALHGGLGLVRRLSEMGLNVGSELRVLQRQNGGLVVLRGGTRLALGGGMAQKILVSKA